MANKVMESLQPQLKQLATTWPQLEQNEQWTELVQRIEQVSETLTHQEKLLETAAAISDAASSIVNVDQLLNVSVNLIKSSFEFYYVGIFLIDETNKWVELKADTHQNSHAQRLKIKDDSTISRAINQQEPYISTDPKQYTTLTPNLTWSNALSEVALPLISRGQVIGTLVIQCTKQTIFATENVRALQTLADQLANAIHNAILFATADRQLGQLIALHNINLQIGSHFDLESLLKNVAEFSTKLISADSCVIRMADIQKELFTIKAVSRPPKGIELNQTEDIALGISGQVAETGHPVLANNWPSHQLNSKENEEAQIQAVLNVPIAIHNKIIGTIEVYSFTRLQAFDENDLYTLSLLASQTATAIEKTRLFNQAEHSYLFLETVIDHIPDPIFIKNQEHTWIAMNQANANIIDKPKHELIGKTEKLYFPEELVNEFHRRDDEVFASNKILEHEDKIVWADEQEHIAYTRLIPIPDESGKPEYLLGITQDITERKAHEAERERFLNETAALYNGSRAIASALSERQIFEALFEQIRLADPCEIAIFDFERVEDELIWAELAATWQKHNNPTYDVGKRFYLPETLHARLLTTNDPIFIEDIATDSRLSEKEREGFAPTQACSIAILPLTSRDQSFGSVIIYFTTPHLFSEVTKRFWLAMVDQAGVALRNRRLVKEAAYRAVQMETAAEVAQAASSLLDLNELLNSAVALIRDRFELYYVGAFLVDEINEWAVLRAGTGEAGRIQLENKHRLKIGGESMIGWSVYHQQPRIALDVGKEAVHFQNPHLPKTRSEMALPLIHRNKAIGALTVQSTEQAAFSREDIVFLQTMANQLANAIENARLFEQAQQELAERKRAEEALRASEVKYRELVENANSIILRINSQGQITFFNEFAQEFFGYTEDEIIGQPVVGTIVPEVETSGRELVGMFDDMFNSPEKYTRNENENIRKNGERVWITWANKVIHDEKGDVTELLCVGNDSTERKRTEEALQKALERTEILYRIGETLASATEERATFESILGYYLRLLNLKRGGLLLFDETSEHNRLQALYIEGQPVEPDLIFPMAEDKAAQHLIENPEPLIIENVSAHPLTKDNHEFRGHVESMLLIPLIIREKVVGIIGADATQKGHTFSHNDIEIGQVVADNLAIWLENRQLLTEAQYRSNLLQMAAEVSGAASSILDVDELINTSVNLIRDQFDFYYVGLFLVEDEWAVLKAGTGQAGRIQLENKHRLKIGGESMIGWSVANRKARIALDVGEEAVHFKNPILPDTHSEMALPLVSRDEVIGALTIQSTERGAFSDEDITLLQTMADQLANALANADLFERVAQSRKEAETRLHETQALQKLSQELAGTLHLDEILDIFFQACSQEIGFEYVQFSLVDKYQNNIKAIAGMGVTQSQIKRANKSLDSADIMADTVRTGKTEIIVGWDARFDKELFESEGHANWVRIFTPITLRQENIGLVEAGFKTTNIQSTIHESQVRLLRTFIDQTALALDNAQRYEASQRAARREALIKDITTKVRASTDLDTILQTTVREIGDALHSKRTYIHVNSPQGTNGHSESDSKVERK